MPKYIIEGNLNFQEELYKLLDEDSENEDDLCQITGLPLKDNFVKLECKHHFNYEAIFKEIKKQKYEFKTYDIHSLTRADQLKFKNSNLDYFIKCPYCRNIQFTILPFYEELGLEQIYGINSLDKSLPNTISLSNQSYNYGPYYGDPAFTFIAFGVNFKFGQCCEKNKINDVVCSQKYTSTIPNTNLSYCKYHYKEGLKQYKIGIKAKELEAKLQAKKEKENVLNIRKKLFEDKNNERILKGLPPLKRLPPIKKPKLENVVENVIEHPSNIIEQYIPDENFGCNCVLKSGPNKGKKCGVKKIDTNGLCNRHNKNKNKTNKYEDN